MNFLNLQEVDYHHHHHHHHHRNRTVDEHHDHMEGGESITRSSRSYDCVFCQRGFTTAQALGGHMNIHRKDRATNPTPTNKPNFSPNNDTFLSNKEMLLDEEDNDNQVNHATNTRLFYSSKNYLSSKNGGSSSFEGRLHRFLGSDSSSRVDSARMHGKRVQGHDHNKEGEELDLELRLGHYSW
ncbi:unnamed protein product [Amaranthus hypochondriacus]